MKSFDFFTKEDYDSGLYINARVDNTQNISEYHQVAVVPDVITSTSVSTYFTAGPQTGWWNVNGDLYTEVANTSYSLNNISGYAVDIIYDNSPTGAFIKQYVDSQNIENVSTYGALGTDTIYRIPLNGYYPQTVKLVNTGRTSKSSPKLQGPTNKVGVSVAPAIDIRSNGTTIISDTWTFTALNSLTFSLKRTGTGVTTTYNTNTDYPNLIPGFDVYVYGTNLVVNDTATLITAPVSARLNSYIVYPSLASIVQYVTPILDSENQNTQWTVSKLEAAYKSTSSYVSQFSAGNTAVPDNTWTTVVPQTVSFIDHTNRDYKQQYRSIVTAQEINGRYAQATVSISSYNDFFRGLSFYCWNPAIDTSMQLVGPVVKGSNVQKILSTFATLYYQWRQKVTRFISSNAVSTSQREYILRQGTLLNQPMHLYEQLFNYRTRLALLKTANRRAGNLSYMQQVLQAYCNNTSIYIRDLIKSNSNWQLGISDLGVNSFVGAKLSNYWDYEIHIPGAIPNVTPDDLVAFIMSLNPVGAVPIIIWE